MYVDDGYVVMDAISGLTSIVQTFPVKLYQRTISYVGHEYLCISCYEVPICAM